jgi:hypothetical protein
MRHRIAVESSRIAPAYAGGGDPRDEVLRRNAPQAPCRKKPVPLGFALVGLLTPLGFALVGLLTLPGIGSAEPAISPPSVSAAPPAAPAHPLEDLIEIPRDSARRSGAQLTDDTIAAAVEAGTNPDLQRRSGFRKRSNDLFRTEREVEIGNQEMLLRLRLRAKSREAVSVELRF